MLKLSSDRKVSPQSKFSSGTWKPEIPNSFGLPAHVSCPGATSVCESICYAFRLERAYTNVAKLLKNNWDELQACGNSVKKMVVLLNDLILRYKAEHQRIETLRGEVFPKVFRIHWDGDFYSKTYAKAWRAIVLNHPDVQFWAYTRSFSPKMNVVPLLAGLDNLSLYLSVDKVNAKWAEKVIDENPGVRIAALGDSFDSHGESAMEISLRIAKRKAPKCPEQTGRYPLVLENGNGACVECMLCVNGTNNVLFSISKK